MNDYSFGRFEDHGGLEPVPALSGFVEAVSSINSGSPFFFQCFHSLKTSKTAKSIQ